MKKILLILLGVFLLCCSTYLVKAEIPKAPVSGFITYEQVLNQEKPAVLYFHSENCTYCVELLPVFKKISKDYTSKFVFATVDVDERKYSKVCDKLKIQTIPAIFIYTPKTKTAYPIHPYYYSEGSLRKIMTEF